jgi:hypothetical protein
MAYTIIRSNGSTLTTIQDGTINTSSTSLGLPGRNYAGYGQTLDTNVVRMVENFANDSVPANPLRGQLWYNTTDSSLRVCPADGTLTASSWMILSSTNNAGDTTLGNLTVTGNVITDNLSVTNALDSDTITVRLATVSANLTAANASITTANLTTIRTQSITSGSTTTSGSLTGVWTVTGNSSSNGLLIGQGNLAFSSSYGVKCDNYMYANGTPFTPTGTYTNANVSDYMTGSNNVVQFTGNIAPTKITTTHIAGGGTISNVWTLSAGARIQATYADLAERYESDAIYAPGTVVEIGGDKEVTAVKADASDEVFGVVSNTAAYLMNAMAGDDETHPAIAVAGRVSVRVIGKVAKGQRLISAGNGKARGAQANELTAFNSIGRSLVNKNDDEEGVIEAVVMIK